MDGLPANAESSPTAKLSGPPLTRRRFLGGVAGLAGLAGKRSLAQSRAAARRAPR